MTNEAARSGGTRAYKPEELYRQVRGIAPDLVVLFGDLHWRSVGRETVWVHENDTGPDEANHGTASSWLPMSRGCRASFPV